MKKQISTRLNVAPRPTIITEYRRQRMIEGFSSPIYKQQSALPIPLGLQQNLPKLCDNLERYHTPQRPVTPACSAVDDLDVMIIKLKKTLIPTSSEHKYKLIYDDENFVNESKRIGTDISIKNIFKKNLMTNLGYESDTSSILSRHSLESGQLDDNDLEVFNITKGYRSNNGSGDERPQSREAFGTKKQKKNHTSSSTTIDGKTVTKIQHKGLPTIIVIGPDLESHDYKDPLNLTRSATLPQNEEEIVLPSEAESETNRPEPSRKTSSSARSSRRQIHHDNEAFTKLDEEIYYGAQSPSFGQGRIDKELPTSNVKEGDEREKAKYKKKSGKHKKRKRIRSVDNKDKNDNVLGRNDEKQCSKPKKCNRDTSKNTKVKMGDNVQKQISIQRKSHSLMNPGGFQGKEKIVKVKNRGMRIPENLELMCVDGQAKRNLSQHHTLAVILTTE